MTSGCRVAIEAAAVPVVIETDAEYAVTHDMAPEVRLISSGDQGPPGPPGGVVIQRSAGHLISALRVVYEASGLVYVLDYRDAAHIDLLVGITMTAAEEVVFVEQSWVPADNAQAADRVHRIGQTKPVRARFLALAGTVDQLVAEALARKTAAINEVLSEKSA